VAGTIGQGRRLPWTGSTRARGTQIARMKREHKFHISVATLVTVPSILPPVAFDSNALGTSSEVEETVCLAV